MKKLFFALAFLLTASSVNAESLIPFGSVGIVKVDAVAEGTSSVRITPTFFNTSATDQSVTLEVSITDNYDAEMFANADRVTSDVLDASLVIPKDVSAFGKSYAYQVPNIAKKDTYRIELRLVDKNRNQIFLLQQTRSLTVGSEVAPKIKTQSFFDYDGRRHALQDGPTVKNDGSSTAMYVVEIENTGTAPVTVSAENYTSRKYASEESVWQDAGVGATSTVVAAGKKGTLRVPARYFDSTGTFEGRIDLYATQAGKKVLLRTDEFRYMIGDVFVVVTGVSVSTSTFTLDISKTIFDSTILLTDDVLNSTTSAAAIAAQEAGVHTFKLVFKDDSGAVVVTKEQSLTWAEISDTTTLPITFAKSEREKVSMVEISISDQQGKTIFNNSFPISVAESVKPFGIREIGLITAIVLLILSLIGYYVTRSRTWLLLFILFVAATLFLRFSSILATTQGVTSGDFTASSFSDGVSPSRICTSHGYQGVTMRGVTIPYGTNFQCGQTEYIRYDPINGTCGNTPMSTYFYTVSATGLSVTNNSGAGVTPNGAPAVRTYSRSAYGGNPAAYPIAVKITPGFTGQAKLTGYYYQVNGACSSKTGNVTFTFNNVKCSQNCSCSGRDQVCNIGGTVSTTNNSPACRPQASCGASVSGGNAVFTTTVTNGLGSLTYRDTSTGQTITNPVSRPIAPGQTVTQGITVTDAFDGLTASASCTITSDGRVTQTCPEGESCNEPEEDPGIISKFLASPTIVNKGDMCRFSWQTTGMALCSFTVDQQEKSTELNSSEVSVSTFDGNNKRGVLTCVASTTSRQTITASTTCRVNPEVRQQ